MTFTSFNAFRSKPRSFLLPKAFFFQRIAAQYGRTVFWTKTSESQNDSKLFWEPFLLSTKYQAAEQGLFYAFLGGSLFYFVSRQIRIKNRLEYIYIFIVTYCHIVSSCCVIHQCKRVMIKIPCISLYKTCPYKPCPNLPC